MKRIVLFLSILPLIVYAGWSRIYSGGSDCRGRSVRQTADGGYIVAGNWFNMFWLLKTESEGDTQWTKKYFLGGQYDIGNCVRQTSDGGYIITGRSNLSWEDCGAFALSVMKTDSMGDTMWVKLYGTECGDDNCGYSIQQISDGNYIITGGRLFSESHWDVWLLKIDQNGDTVWSRRFGGDDFDEGRSVKETSDGGFIIAGTTYINGSENDLYLIKTDSEGYEVWTKTYGEEDKVSGRCVQQTSDGGFIVVCRRFFSSSVMGHIWLLKTDSYGDTVWTKQYSGDPYSFASEVQLTSDGGFVIIGRTSQISEQYSDILLIKTDSTGEVQWERTYGGEHDDWGYSVQQTTDAGYILSGSKGIYTPSFRKAIWLIKTGPDGDTLTEAISEQLRSAPTFEVLTSIGPQVLCFFSPSAKRSQASVFDALGRKVDEIDVPKAGGVVNWGEEHNPGVYFIVADIDGNRQAEKVILVK